MTPTTGPTMPPSAQSVEEDTCMSYEEEDTCMSYEEEDTCRHQRNQSVEA